MFKKSILPTIVLLFSLVFITNNASAQKRYSGRTHTTSHGGNYGTSSGSSHRGGHYRLSSTGNHYGRHKY